MISFEDFVLGDGYPIYLQIIRHIKQGIAAGAIGHQEEVPSRRVLSALLGVNPNTMQRAFSELEREGLVYTQRTNGRFITEDLNLIDQLKQQMALDAISGFLKIMRQLGFSGEDTLRLLKEALKEETA